MDDLTMFMVLIVTKSAPYSTNIRNDLDSNQYAIEHILERTKMARKARNMEPLTIRVIVCLIGMTFSSAQDGECEN